MQLERNLRHLQRQLQQSVLTLAAGPLVVGVSGGLDSCVLLHLLVHSVNQKRHPLVPCYIEHGIRSAHVHASVHAHAHAEKEGLREYCRGLGLVLRVFSLPQGWLKKKAHERGLSLEDLARQERYRRLRYCAESLGQNAKGGLCLVLAHHAGDQDEGFLMHLLQGSGPWGLAGMREYSYLQGHENVLLWRPLLSWQPRDLQRWGEVHSVPHWEDESNFCQDTVRNFYRWQVLPQLRRLLPRFNQGLQRSREHLSLVQDWLERERAVLEGQVQVQQLQVGPFESKRDSGQEVFTWSGDFTTLAAPLQVELFYLLFDRIRAGEQRRRRLPFGFVRELQRQYAEAGKEQQKYQKHQAHGCIWVLSPQYVRAWGILST